MDMFNRSPTSTTLICYQQPKKCYELGLATTTTMIQRFPMKMCGSGEQHSCFVYVKEEHHMLSSAPLKVVLPTTPVNRGAPDRLKGNPVLKTVGCVVVGWKRKKKKGLIHFISLLLLLLLLHQNGPCHVCQRGRPTWIHRSVTVPVTHKPGKTVGCTWRPTPCEPPIHWTSIETYIDLGTKNGSKTNWGCTTRIEAKENQDTVETRPSTTANDAHQDRSCHTKKRETPNWKLKDETVTILYLNTNEMKHNDTRYYTKVQD